MMELIHLRLNLSILILATLLLTCNKSDDDSSCNSTSLILPNNNICLSIEHEGLSDNARAETDRIIREGIVSINNIMPIEDVQIRVVENFNFIIPEIGIGGYNPAEDAVIIAIDASFNNLETSLANNLVAMLAHELHHAKRRRSVGYGNTLLQAIISEGLADHFSIEVTGINPPLWSTALGPNELDSLTNEARTIWNNTSYNHNEWFFGTGPTIPRWAGYTIGYELVNNFLMENPGQLPSQLHDEPASSFE